MGHETLIGCTMATSLKWDDNQEKAVDRVTAIAISSKRNELGALMLRVEATDAQSLRKAIKLIARRLNHKHRVSRGFAERMANAVLHECLHPHCTHCEGRGERHSEGEAVLTCTHCSGSGLRRYTDRDRHSIVGSPFNKPAYECALGFVRDSLHTIVRGANYVLTS